jgi:hypothetical protein
MRKDAYIAGSIISGILLAAAIAILCNIDKFGTAFFQFTLMDSVNLLVSIVIGFYVTYSISVSFQNQFKKNEIIVDALDMLHTDLSALMNKLQTIDGQPLTQVDMNRVTLFFRIARNDLKIAIDLCGKKSFVSKELSDIQIGISELNQSVTDKDFYLGSTLSEVYHTNCIEKYYKLKNHIFQCKNKMFT